MSDDMTTTIGVVGCGTWGVSLASLLAWKGFRVRGWDVDTELLARLSETRSHPKLPGLQVPKNIDFNPDLDSVIEQAEAQVLVAPSVAMRQTCGLPVTSETNRRWLPSGAQ